ncbi:MAG: helix-turn-helix domain-containing protein [Flavobacteriaceae bacterium]|nr:helix-turn-helix domain-containing protein [Flavobacteriaceae bacterium]MDZ4148044.1 helix-turn-helix domain-containing protein [Flavobacteriaceae bacterium]
MNSIRQIERLRKIHELIKMGKTGCPSQFARKLGVSESQLYNILERLKTFGFPIGYSRKLQSYFYEDDCDLEVHFSVKLLTSGENIKILGGQKKYFTPMQLECRHLI